MSVHWIMPSGCAKALQAGSPARLCLTGFCRILTVFPARRAGCAQRLWHIYLDTSAIGGGMARQAADPKAAELAASRTLNRHPEAVTDEDFAAAEFFDARDLVQVKYEMVRKAGVGGAGVSAAAAAFGFSRQSYYTAAAALEAGGLAALVPARPGPRGGHKLTDEVLAWAEEQLTADPALRAKDLAGPLQAQFGVAVHPRSIEKGLARYRDRSKRPGPPPG